MTQQPASAPHRALFLRTVKAVAWSFIGIRKTSEFHEDVGKLNPLHIIAVALLGVVLFVVALVLLVNWIVR